MEDNIRPINYLGSKLRILDEIKNQIDKLDPEKGGICDLFAGSGTVANFMAKERKVIAFDIQEYSRVICSALLNREDCMVEGRQIVQECLASTYYSELKNIFGDISEYESKVIDLAVEQKKKEPLCEFLENASFVAFDRGEYFDSCRELSSILAKCSRRYMDSDMYGKVGKITYLYGGVYFSFEQTIEIDTVLCWIDENVREEQKDKYLAAVISAASDIVNTVGKQFAQPIAPRNSKGEAKKNLGMMISRDRRLSFWKSFVLWFDYYKECGYKGCKVYKSNYIDAIRRVDSDIKIVYADPPYTRYHYSRYYHVLETIALGDFPEISTVKMGGKEKTSKGIYRLGRYQSPFCIKSMAYNAFEEMFKELQNRNMQLILSYSPFEKDSQSTPRMVSIEEICDMANRYYKNVDLITLNNIVHNKFNSKEKNFNVSCPAEMIIVCS